MDLFCELDLPTEFMQDNHAPIREVVVATGRTGIPRVARNHEASCPAHSIQLLHLEAETRHRRAASLCSAAFEKPCSCPSGRL